MPAARTKRLEVAKRRREEAELYLQGCTQIEIAERIGLSQSAVSLDLKALQTEWRKQAVQDIDLKRAEELQRLAVVEREARDGYERSKKPSQSAVVNGDGGQTRKSLRNRDGDPRFLEVMLKCVAARREILGLDAPWKVAATTPDGSEAAPANITVHNYPPEILRGMLDLKMRMLMHEQRMKGSPAPQAGGAGGLEVAKVTDVVIEGMVIDEGARCAGKVIDVVNRAARRKRRR